MLKAHPIADIFPLIQGEEFDQLKVSVRKNGLLEPITLLDGAILDGRNRYRACIETGILPQFEQYQGETSATALWAFVKAKNKDRRHLTSGRWATVAVEANELVERLEAEARERQRINALTNQPQNVEKIPPSEIEPAKTREILAEMFGTNPRYIQDAKKLKSEAPEIFEQVKVGEISMGYARRKAGAKKSKAREQKRAAQTEAPKVTPVQTIVGDAANLFMIQDGVIDVIITSPPYNLGTDAWPMGGHGRQARDNGIGYDDNMSGPEYIAWQMDVFRELYRVTKEGGSLFYNHKTRTLDGRLIHPMDWLRDVPDWILRQEIVWDREVTHNHSKTLFWPTDERIYWFTKGKPFVADAIGMPTVWRFHGPAPHKWHPAPFSEELPRRCLQAIGGEGLVVLDPFAGSCTTGVAAVQMGHIAIMVDCKEEYLATAKQEHGW